MASFVTVLKSGGRYHPGWVAALRDGVARHGRGFDRFVVLSDLDIELPGIDRIPLVHSWPSWWSKLEAFRPGLFHGPVVLCDLDTIISGPIDRLAEPGPAVMEDAMLHGRASTALMRWSGNELAFVYEAFRSEPRRWMEPGSCGPVPNAVHGDQVVLDHLLRRAGRMPAFVQTLYPDLIEFFDEKRGCRGPVTVFIGDTKPHFIGDRLVPPQARIDAQAMSG